MQKLELDLFLLDVKKCYIASLFEANSLKPNVPQNVLSIGRKCDNFNTAMHT